MIYVRHYFPGVNIETMTDEDFALLSEDALWLHQQMQIAKIASSLPRL
jgi:hypothetical protein